MINLTDQELNEWVSRNIMEWDKFGSFWDGIQSEGKGNFNPSKNLNHTHLMEEKIMQCPLPQASVPGVGLIFRVLWDLPTARKSEKDCLTFEDAKRYKEELRKAGELLGISHILNIKIEVYEK